MSSLWELVKLHLKQIVYYLKHKSMETRRSNVKMLVLFSLSMCLCVADNAQDYYGGGGNGSWRRQPSNYNRQRNRDTANNEPSGYFSVNFGFATPEGSFGQGIGSQYGGYALGGSNFNFSIGIPINHTNFGIALMYGSYDNEYDLNTFSNNNYVSPIYPDQNDYSEGSIMGGLYVTYPVINRLSVDARLMGGVLLSSLPEQDIAYQDVTGDIYQYDIQPSNSTSFAFDAGIGLRFMVAEFGRRKVCIMANVDYIYSSVSYNTEQIEYYTPYANNPTNITYQTNYSITGHLPVQLLNITFGIGYQL